MWIGILLTVEGKEDWMAKRGWGRRRSEKMMGEAGEGMNPEIMDEFAGKSKKGGFGRKRSNPSVVGSYKGLLRLLSMFR